MQRTILVVAVGLALISRTIGSAWANAGDEHPGQELDRLGARTGVSALAVWPRVMDETKKLQSQNNYTFVVIGQDWKGGIEGLKHLKAQPGVRGVMFSHPDFSDDWCECLKEMCDLKEIFVNGEGFTDKGMNSLRNLKELEALSFLETRITDEGLACLEDKTRLQWLSLALALSVTDKGMAHLRNATELRNLNLDTTNVSGDGMAHLKNATKMEWLRLSGLLIVEEDGPNPRLANAGLKHLMGMKDLKYLSIGSMRILEEDSNLRRNSRRRSVRPPTEREARDHMRAEEALIKALLNKAKGLKRIETSNGVWTREGWKEEEPESIKEKLNRAADRIRENIKE